MARQDRTAHAGGSTRTNLYDEITGKIIAELEEGRLPWVQPWGRSTTQAPLGLPQNASTGRAYSGINILILWGAVVQHGYPGQGWLTFRQALSLGGNVRKGEHGTTVVYADRFTPEDEKRRARETGEEPGKIPFLKRFTVFNTAQCEGLPEDITVAVPPPPPGLIEPRVEALIKAMESGASSRHPAANAGIAVAYAGRRLSIPVSVFVPETTSERAKALIRQEGADVFVHGASWQEANERAPAAVDHETAFIHPFDDPLLWAGQAPSSGSSSTHPCRHTSSATCRSSPC